MHFQTERLTVRDLTIDDFPAFFEMQGNPNVLRFTGTPPDDETSARSSLENCINCYSKPGNDFWVWAVERKSDGAMVGTAAIVGKGHEIGYRFLEKFWGNGYASEICNPLIDHAFEVMDYPSVFAEVDVRNVASVKVLDRSKLNFVKQYFNEKDNCTDRLYRLSRKEVSPLKIKT